MITESTYKMYTVFEVLADGTEVFVMFLQAYTPLDCVVECINDEEYGWDNDEHTFAVMGPHCTRTLIRAKRGWVVDFVPYLEQKGACLNDSPEAK